MSGAAGRAAWTVDRIVDRRWRPAVPVLAATQSPTPSGVTSSSMPAGLWRTSHCAAESARSPVPSSVTMTAPPAAHLSVPMPARTVTSVAMTAVGQPPVRAGAANAGEC